MMPLIVLLWVNVVLAEWPVSYEDALTHAVKANPSLALARVFEEDARVGVMAAKGIFDPHFVADSQYRNSQSKGFFQGFPFNATQRTWRTGTGLNGLLWTGASYSFSGSVDRNLSTYLTQFAGSFNSESVQDAFTAQVDFSITQPVLEGWRLNYQLRHITRARSDHALAQLRVERSRQQILYSTASAYWSWLYLLEVERIAGDSVGVAEDAYASGTSRFTTGELAAVELSRLDAARVQAAIQVLDARVSRVQAENTLLMTMGQPTGQAIVPASSLESSPAHGQVIAGEVVEVALAQNLDLLIKRAELEQSRVDRRNARHERLPSLSVTVGTGRGSQVVASDQTQASAKGAIAGLWGEEAYPYGMVSAQLDVPLGDRTSRSGVAHAAFSVQIKTIELSELERQVSSDVAVQVMRLTNSTEKVRLAQANRAFNRLQLTAEEAFVQTGTKRMVEVLRARNNLRQSEAELAKSRADARLAMAELLRLTGQLDRE